MDCEGDDDGAGEAAGAGEVPACGLVCAEAEYEPAGIIDKTNGNAAATIRDRYFIRPSL